MRALFVAEKNDAAKGIAAILSRGTALRRESHSRWNKIYQFTAEILNQQRCTVVLTSVAGHLLQHQFPQSHKNWISTPMKTLFDVPIQKSIIPGMEDIKRTLMEEIRNSDILVIWTDCDREGEDIGAEIVTVCKEVKPRIDVFRARFSEITQAAIWRAVNSLCRLDQRMVDAVECRSELDLRIGAAFSRLQTLHLREKFATIFQEHNEVVSYGSCQFPTLGFVVERYKAIQNFITEQFWKLEVHHKYDNFDVEFTWERGRLFDQRVVQVLHDICEEDDNAHVVSVTKKPKSRWRPIALDTVELEKLAVRKLHISAKDAMYVAEKLYTKGYISYPRTETNKFPSNLNLLPFVEHQTANADWGEFAQSVLTGGITPRNGTKSDEAHPPIHPLKFASHNELIGLEWAIYELVVRHFLACISTNATGQETSVNISLGGEEFYATGLVIDDYGYLKVYKYDKWNDKTLPMYTEGQVLSDYKVVMKDGYTQPPPLLNEADLIGLMEKYGIGTDATHAEHIEKIKKRQYATLNKENRFLPGYLGLALVDGYDNMGFAMSKPHLRANLESQLKQICRGEKSRVEVLKEQIDKYKRIFEQTEDKIVMISNAFRQYLSLRNQEINTLSAGDSETSDQNGTGRRRRSAGTPSSTASAASRARAPRKKSASKKNKENKEVTTVVHSSSDGGTTTQQQQAFTNTSDIDLLESLSILNDGRRRSRTRNSDVGTRNNNNNSGLAQSCAVSSSVGQQKLCRCNLPAVRLQVRKEGPNKGRYFFSCSKDRHDPKCCNYFEWDSL
uniref:DNA topoisomerase n=1 Tax=Syphacia muris TaxID=451379 RepID=A0A158R560_9BILA